jgi:hypothetical protein
MVLIPRIAAADMIGRPQAPILPILLHAIDALRRAQAPRQCSEE